MADGQQKACQTKGFISGFICLCTTGTLAGILAPPVHPIAVTIDGGSEARFVNLRSGILLLHRAAFCKRPGQAHRFSPSIPFYHGAKAIEQGREQGREQMKDLFINYDVTQRRKETYGCEQWLTSLIHVQAVVTVAITPYLRHLTDEVNLSIV